MKNKLLKWWVLIIIAIPFLLMFCLHIGIALGNYFGININVRYVDASTWFTFFSNYLGGAMTLAGVMITLRHERNVHQYENALENIDKEKNTLGKAICELNIFAPSIFYRKFNSLQTTPNGYNSAEVASIQQQLAEELQKINKSKCEVEFFTEIYVLAAGCRTCNKPCGIQAISPEFQKIYEEVGNQLFTVLQMIDFYISQAYSNALYIALINNCKETNERCQLSGKPLQYDESIIKEYKSKIVKLEPKQNEIVEAIAKVNNYNQVEVPRLSVLVREYIAIKQKNAYKKWLGGKED